MAGEWSIVVPEAGTNLVLNQSFEFDAVGGTAATSWAKSVGTETYLIDSAQARFGFRSLKVITAATTASGPTQDVTALTSASTQYTFSIYARGTATVRAGLFDTTTGYQYSNPVTLSSTAWTRVSVTATVGNGASRFVALLINSATASTFWVDGAQLEQSDHVTTYIDGDRVDANVPGGYRWNGVAHGSTSTRSAQVRSGGRENVIDATYNVFADTDGTTGQGVAPLENITQEYALQPGGEFQETKIRTRVMTLRCKIPGGDLATTHSRRKAFWNVIKPDLTAPTQPFVLVYNEALSTNKLYGSFYYESGMDVTGNDLALLSSFDLRLVAVDPYWYEDNQEQTALTVQATLAADYAFGRINGTWQRFGTGFNDLVYCTAIDYQRNRVYFGGKFTTANGVTCNGIAYWDGTTFQPLGAATKGIGVAGTGIVYSIAIAPNGDVWGAGNFTTAGGSATKGLAKWAAVGTSAPTVFATSTTFTDIRSIVIDRNYRIYIGGNFTGFNGTANCSYFTYSSDQGTTWVAPTTTPADATVNTLALDIDNLGIYLGGIFTGIAGVSNTARIAKYSGGSFTALSTGADATVNSLAVKPDGTLFAGGGFTSAPGAYLAKWSGSAWTSIPTGVSDAVVSIVYDRTTNLLYFIQQSMFGVHFYNGSGIGFMDVTFSAYPTGIIKIAVNGLTGDMYIPLGNIAATTTSESGIATVTVVSTAATYPVIIIGATTTAASQTSVSWIENQSTRQRIYLNTPSLSDFKISAGETLTLDLRPGKKTLTSNWRGDLTSFISSQSDLANFKLLPGANTIAFYAAGTITGATAIIQDVPQHLAVDGGAA